MFNRENKKIFCTKKYLKAIWISGILGLVLCSQCESLLTRAAEQEVLMAETGEEGQTEVDLTELTETDQAVNLEQTELEIAESEIVQMETEPAETETVQAERDESEAEIVQTEVEESETETEQTEAEESETETVQSETKHDMQEPRSESSTEMTELQTEPETEMTAQLSAGVRSISDSGEGYRLPETGGGGTYGYTLGGLLFLTVPLLYRYRRKYEQGRGERQTHQKSRGI